MSFLQESIVQHVNEHPQAGWKATMNPRFSNYSVSCNFNLILLLMVEIWLVFSECPTRFLLLIFVRTLFLFVDVLTLLFIVQVSQFKYLLGVKQTPEKDLKSTPVLSHPKSLKLPKSFDAREAWPQCISIGTILG